MSPARVPGNRIRVRRARCLKWFGHRHRWSRSDTYHANVRRATYDSPRECGARGSHPHQQKSRRFFRWPMHDRIDHAIYNYIADAMWPFAITSIAHTRGHGRL